MLADKGGLFGCHADHQWKGGAGSRPLTACADDDGSRSAEALCDCGLQVRSRLLLEKGQLHRSLVDAGRFLRQRRSRQGPHRISGSCVAWLRWAKACNYVFWHNGADPLLGPMRMVA